MKYRDNKFLKYQDKQRDDEFDYFSNKTERQIRRERNHKHSQFYIRVLSKNIEKIWWNNLSDIDKDEIIRRYNNQMDYLSQDMGIRESTAKFASECGWPSFFEQKNKKSVVFAPDHSYNNVS